MSRGRHVRAVRSRGGRGSDRRWPGPARARRAQDRRRRRGARCVLRLYVAGASRGSRRAVERVREFCDRRLAGRYELSVVDIYQLPALAKEDQIVATPTLVRAAPSPLRRFIGDLTRLEDAFFGRDLREET